MLKSSRHTSILVCASLLGLVSACGSTGYESPGDNTTDKNVPAPAADDAGQSSSTVVSSNTPATDTNVTGSFSLTLQASGFAMNSGKNVVAELIDNTNTIIANGSGTVAANGNFAVTFAQKLTAGQTYSVAYYVDVNANGFCNISPTDAGDITQVASVKGDTVVPVVLNAKATNVCEAFGQYGITVNGTGFTPHNGETLYVGVMDMADQTYVAGPGSQVVINAAWRYSWNSVLLAGHTYEIRYFIDQQKTQVCQNHSWIYNIGAVAGNIAAAVAHSDKQVAVCTNFPAVK